ncbi:MAG: metallophosphoesterase [Clostridia bacterium]|jgi:predicted phosphodiesterase|nr:metallophosphoesterase [Clostridia bacterium]
MAIDKSNCGGRTVKIAVFSDVHGNLKALKTTLEQIKEKSPDLTIFLGDIFQRGNEETECLELLKASGIICLKGNCELYAEHGVDIDPDVEYLRDYYDGVRKNLTAGQMQFIRQMPLIYETDCCGHMIRFSHFLFSDIHSDYPFLQLSSLKNGGFDRACQSEEVLGYELVVVGHSHRNFAKGNVVSVSAIGLEGASYLLIDGNADAVSYERYFIDVSPEQ